jgi:hypothetical protein
MDKEKHINKIVLILILLWVFTIIAIASLMFLGFSMDSEFWDAIGEGNIFDKPK